jgi:hypothetical protein
MEGIRRPWRRVVSSGLCGPVAVTLVSLLLLLHVFTTATIGVQAGAYGPQSWPQFALILLVVGLGLHCAIRARNYTSGRAVPRNAEQPTLPGATRVTGATALIAVYGAGFVYAGFLFSTIAFLAAWLTYTRYRKLLPTVLISVLGTILPLYLLIKVAYMPLPRGVGLLEDATVQLYHWLRLF